MLLFVVVIGMGCVLGFVFASRMLTVQGQEKPGMGFAAIPGAVGGQDTFGGYEIVKDWPKNISTLPGNDKWTWGAGQGIYAESPNRVFLLFRGELPNIPRPKTTKLADLAPSLSFPIGRLPWRDATAAALPGAGGSGQDPDDGPRLWRGANPPYNEIGVDAKWEHCLTVVDGSGNIIETVSRSTTKCSSARISWPSIPTIRRSTSGSSTITCTPFTNSRMT